MKKKPEKSDMDELKELQQQLNDLQKEKDEIFGRLQRVCADYANFQKRMPKQIADSIAYEKENIIKALLPVLDNFERTLLNAHSTKGGDVLVKGVKIIYDQMLDILKLHGVEQMQSLGETFDPAMHEAVMQKSEQDKKDNIVLEEDRKGYKLNGRIIRPSKVVVNKLTSEVQTQKIETGKPEEIERKPDEQKLEKENNQ